MLENKIIFLAFVLLAPCAFTMLAQTQPPQSAGVNQAAPASWFTATKAADGLWIISDHGADNIYLVEGSDKALLIDTGLGVARLSAFIKTLTTKPLMVVNTHGHPDHAGGDFEFKSVYAHPADFSSIQSFSTKEARQRSTQFMAQGPATSDRISAEEAASAPQPDMLSVVVKRTRYEIGLIVKNRCILGAFCSNATHIGPFLIILTVIYNLEHTHPPLF